MIGNFDEKKFQNLSPLGKVANLFKLFNIHYKKAKIETLLDCGDHAIYGMVDAIELDREYGWDIYISESPNGFLWVHQGKRLIGLDLKDPFAILTFLKAILEKKNIVEKLGNYYKQRRKKE